MTHKQIQRHTEIDILTRTDEIVTQIDTQKNRPAQTHTDVTTQRHTDTDIQKHTDKHR